MYIYNPNTLQFYKVGWWQRNYIYLILITCFILSSFKPVESIKTKEEYISFIKEENAFTELNFKSKLKELKIKYPDVVWAQSKIESASYTSPIFKENNNMLGIKVSTTRPSTFIGENRGHASYDTWQDCLIDYAIWQSTFTRGLSKEQYLQYLGKVYAEDSNYEAKIRRKLKDFKW